PGAWPCAPLLSWTGRRDRDLSQICPKTVPEGLARLEGFEPPTNGFGSHYSIRLSYRRVSKGLFLQTGLKLSSGPVTLYPAPLTDEQGLRKRLRYPAERRARTGNSRRAGLARDAGRPPERAARREGVLSAAGGKPPRGCRTGWRPG